MKIQDYWRLAKISLKARKKSTRSTICGMSISLIIILPLIFAMIGVNASILPQLNKNPQLLYAIFASGEKGSSFVYDDSTNNMSTVTNNFSKYNSSYDYVDRTSILDQLDEDILHYTIKSKALRGYTIMESTEFVKFYERIEVDGKNYPMQVSVEKVQNGYGAKSLLAVVSEKDLGKLQKSSYGVLGSRYNKGFTGDGHRQVILSTQYLQMAGLKAEDVYGKTISIFMREKTNYSTKFAYDGVDETDYLDHYLLRDFKVVGINEHPVVDDNIANDINYADIIVADSSYYNSNGKAAISHQYEFRSSNDNNSQVICNAGNVAYKNELAKNYIFTGLIDYADYEVAMETLENGNKYSGKLFYNCANYYKYMPDVNKPNPYGQLSKVMTKIQPAYKDMYDSVFIFQLAGPASEHYTMFGMINFVLTIVMSALSIFAGIVLFAALVNLFNTIMHSVSSRKNYLGVMRAIGARSSVIPKLYLFEVLRVFAMAFLWIAVIGGGICIGVKFLFDYLFEGSALGITISISWGILPIALAVILALLLVVGVVYAIGCSWKLSRTPITETLEG